MHSKLDSIRKDLERCRNAKRQPVVFGGDTHGFKLNPCVEESAIKQFESRHDIELPDGYRQFLTELGNGGAGPYYGVFKMGEMDDSFSHKRWKANDGFIGILSTPFPYTDSWNDVPPHPQAQDDENCYEAKQEAFDEFYWNSTHVNGAIPICHQGCACRNWLVVTGVEAGNVWEDLRSDHKGLLPVKFKGKRRVSFLEWYDVWLQEAVATLSK